jgi:hypothetical protein
VTTGIRPYARRQGPRAAARIASIFVTKSESNHSFQPGHMHS